MHQLLLKDWDDQIYRALAHPIRRDIITYLHSREHGSFTDLLKHVDIHDHGKLGFHLRALGNLIEYDQSRKRYRLTERGQTAYELILDARFSFSFGRIDLTFEPDRYGRRLNLGDHAVLFYETEDIKRAVSLPFLRAGLLNREAVIYLAPEDKMASEAWKIERHGIKEDLFPRGVFMIQSAEEWYLKEGKAQPEKIIANLEHLVWGKKREGFRGLRIAGEMKVLLDHGKSEELFRFEAALGRQNPNLCLLCLYESQKLDEEQFFKLNKLHNHSIFRGLAMKTIKTNTF